MSSPSPVPLPAGISSAPAANAPTATAATAQPTGPIQLIWSTVGDEAVSSGVKILVYGPAGAGKTVLCATLPLPIVFISAESGLLSLSVQNLTKIFIGLGMDEAGAFERAKAVKACPVIIVKNGLQLRGAYEWLANPANSQYFKSVAWDSSSETAEVMLNAAKSTKADGRQAYGEVADIIAEYFRKFRGLTGKHVCVTAKLGSKQDGVTGAIIGAPDFPGKQLGPQSPYWLDETFRLGVATDPTTNKVFRFLQTQPDASYDAKDRSGMLETWEKPDLAYLIDKMTTQSS